MGRRDRRLRVLGGRAGAEGPHEARARSRGFSVRLLVYSHVTGAGASLASVAPDRVSLSVRAHSRCPSRSVRRTERDKQARAEAATAHAAAQVTESDPAESPEGAVEEDDAASPAVASPSGEGGVRGRDGGAEAEAEAGAPAKGAAGGDEEEGEERVATPAKGPEKAAPSSDDVPSPASGSGAEGQSDESETPESAAAAAAGPAAKPRAAKRLATEETAGEEEAKSKWSMVAPATGHRLVGKKARVRSR